MSILSRDTILHAQHHVAHRILLVYSTFYYQFQNKQNPKIDVKNFAVKSIKRQCIEQNFENILDFRSRHRQ